VAGPPSRERTRLRGNLTGATHHPSSTPRQGDRIGAAHHVGCEHGEQRIQIGATDGVEERLDHVAVGCEVTGQFFGGNPHLPASPPGELLRRVR
jgi:hypothetical protein